MGSEQTSRWKHTDSHADLRAFLGDAAGLFNDWIAHEARDHLYIELVHRYGLSSALAEQAISALELAHGDSHVAYELLAQWSLNDPNQAQPTSGTRIARRLAKLDEQPTHDEGLAIEQAAWSEVEAAAASTELEQASETSVEEVISRRYAEFLRNRLDRRLHSRVSVEEAISDDLCQRLVSAGVRQFGMRPHSARETFESIVAEAIARRKKRDSCAGKEEASASPDTLPDLDCIMEEEAHLLVRNQAEPDCIDSADDTNQSQRDAFRDYVDQRLANIRGNLVDARHWKKWTDYATVYFGLTSNDAAHLIEERTHKKRMQVLTPQRAVDQLTALAAGLYHRHGKFTAKVRNRLLSAANQLGVDASEVRRILDLPPPPPVAPVASGQPSYRLLLGVSASAAAIMIGFFAWVAMSQGPSGPSVVRNSTNTDNAPIESVAEPFQPPIWWDRQTMAAAEVVSTANVLNEDLLTGFAADSARERKSAALGLLDRIDFGDRAFLNHRDQFRQMFVGYLALEPEQQVALDAYRTIAESLNDFTVEWPEDQAVHASIYWRLDVLLSAIESPLSTRARADAFAVALTDTLQVARETTQDLLALRNACALNVTNRCYAVLMNSTNRSPAAILAVHGSLSLACRPFVEPVHVDRFESKLLCSLLLDGRQWNDFRHLIRHQIGSRDPLNVLRFVAAYERMADTPTRGRLGAALLSRVELGQKGRTPEQVARVVRTALEHGQRGDRFVGRWERFTFESERWLATNPGTTNDRMLPQALIEVAHRNLLGAALSLHDSAGASVFDQFDAEGAPQLLLDPSKASQARFPLVPTTSTQADMPPHVAKELLRRCHQLATDPTSGDQEHDWEIAIRIIDRWRDVPPPVATLLGRFMLSPLDSQLESRVLADSRQLLFSTDLRLAIAESVEESELDDAALAIRLSTLLDRQVTFGDSADRADFRHALLLAIYRDLRPTPISLPTGTVDLNGLREQLTRTYRAKARLLDVSPGAYLTASNPAEILAAIVDQSIERHNASDEPLLRALRARLESTRFRATSELEETVLLQRVWVDLLAWKATKIRPSDAPDIEEIVAELKAQSGENLLRQLITGESAELQLWLLRNELQ